jgi:predicted RNA-binding protein with EMAP domain
MPDVSQDARLLVAEHAIAIMGPAMDGKIGAQIHVGKDTVRAELHEINAIIQQLKFSFMDLDVLAASQEVKTIQQTAENMYKELEDVIKADGTPQLSKSRLLWGIRILGLLSRRFKRGPGGMEKGVDLVVAKVRNATQKGNLTLCKLEAGMVYTSVTNIVGVSSGMTVGVAILPPAEVGGVISEAMFLGKEEVQGEPGQPIDDDAVDTKEVESILYQILNVK